VNRPGLRAGCVTKRIAGFYDGEALFSKLSRASSGGHPPLLFQQTGGLGLIMTGAALRLRCSNAEVNVTACHDGALPLLDAMEHRLGPHVVARAGHRLTLSFPRCDDPDEEAAETRYKASAVLRAIAEAGP
jgi:hypothetical protein